MEELLIANEINLAKPVEIVLLWHYDKLVSQQLS